ncbi:hypothetical protein CKO09_12020 [Chromatium weissei]|nr:hypothetical protein [Chromatium weissei]
MNYNRLSDIINSTTDWETDAQGRYTIIAGRMDTILGYHPDELIGKTRFELMAVDEAARLIPVLKNFFTRKIPFKDIQIGYLHRDGSIRYLLSSGVPILDEYGNLRGFRGTDRDITNEKLTQDRLRERETQLQAIFDHSFVGIMLITGDRMITRANKRLAAILGYENPEELIGMSVKALHLSEEHFNQFGSNFYAKIRFHAQTHIEYQLKRKDGSTCCCLLSGKALDSEVPANLKKGVIWIIDDIDDLKNVERALRESEARYRTLFESSNEGMLVMRDGHFISMNLTARRLFGLDHTEEDRYLTPALLSPAVQPDGQDSAHKSEQMMALAFQYGVHRFEWEHQRTDGKRFQVEISLSRIQIDADSALLVTMHDLSHRHEIDYLSYHDQLTNLPNSNLLRERLTQTIKYAAFTQSKVAVLTLDLDGFKHVMDAHRHEIWEQVLKIQAGRLVAHAPPDAIVARMTGDVFTVAIDNIQDGVRPLQLTKQLQKGLHTPLVLFNGSELCMTVCIGVALYPDDSTDANELLRKAGAALHKAKEQGPGSITFYAPSMTLASTNRLQLLQQLRQALQNNEFELHFQPKINLTTASVVGGEALIRWRRGDGTLVSPGEFIPIVETSDLVHSVGYWVLYAALNQLQQWAANGIPLCPISINIAGPQFARGTLPEEIAEALKKTGVAPQLLQIELLEGQLLDDPEQTRRQLNAIREIGVSVALDDFGTGYSSLSYLSRFPVDFLKIDRSFVRHLNENSGNLAIVRATIAMAQGLGMRTVAEGVETEAELMLLHRLHCHFVQGYYTGKPMSATAFAQFISAKPETVLPPALFKLVLHGVLIVEDDPIQRQLFTQQLTNQGFSVFAVDSAEAVWNVIASEEIYVLMADYGLPGMDGITLLQQVRDRYPEIVRIMLSAASDAHIPAAAINRGSVFRYFTKPCRTQDLCDAVREGIHLAQMMRQSRYTEMSLF